MLLTFAVVFIPLISSSWAGDPCPPKEELGPCSCSHGDNDPGTVSSTTYLPVEKSEPSTPTSIYLGSTTIKKLFRSYQRTTVTCDSPSSLIALQEVMTLAFHRKTVDKLVLYKVPPQKEHVLSVLPIKWLSNTRVKMLEIADTVLSGDFIAFGEPLEGQEKSLLCLTVKFCFLYGALTGDSRDTVNTKGLNKLSYLESLDLSFNHLTAVSASAFRSPPVNLTTLILSYNSLKTLEASCFSAIIKLKYIDLSHNLLESVTRTIFPSSAINLEYIDLSWNFLKQIPSDFFNSMPSLRTVKLEKNFLYSMPERPWRIVWKNLTLVNVTGNFIRCDCDLKWLIPLVPETIAVGNESRVSGTCIQDVFPVAKQHRISTLTYSQLVC